MNCVNNNDNCNNSNCNNCNNNCNDDCVNNNIINSDNTINNSFFERNELEIKTNIENVCYTNNNQIIKKKFPIEILINFLNNICQKKYNRNYYVVNLLSYKKAIFDGSIKDFIDKCIPYYYLSKRKYLTREMNYNHFMTIIRQICNHLKINYTNKIKYERSSYDIVYTIYLTPRDI